MSIAKIYALASVIILCSCGDTACQSDNFFCSDPNTWASQLERFDDQRLFSMYVTNYRYIRPPSSSFAYELGRRRERAIVLLRRHLVDHERDRDFTFYAPILYSVSENSYDFCGSPYRRDFINILSDQSTDGRTGGQSEAQKLEQLCSEVTGAE